MRRHFLLLVVTAIALLVAAPGAMAARAGFTTFSSDIATAKPPRNTVKDEHRGTVTMVYRRVSASYIFVKTIAVHGNRLDCIEFPEGNPPARNWTARYSRIVRFDQRVRVRWPAGATLDPGVFLDKGDWFEYPHSDWEWKWRMTVTIGEVSPSPHIYLEPSLTMKPNQFAECSIGGRSVKPLL